MYGFLLLLLFGLVMDSYCVGVVIVGCLFVLGLFGLLLFGKYMVGLNFYLYLGEVFLGSFVVSGMGFLVLFYGSLVLLFFDFFFCFLIFSNLFMV